MLEKMGWSKGKGLGAREDGTKQHITPVTQTGSEGFGWREKDNSKELNSNFEDILMALNQEHVASSNDAYVSPGVKTEDKNTSCTPAVERRVLKVRHRYRKVLQAKDVSSYSQADLAKIFAVKTDRFASTEQMMLSSDKEELTTSNFDKICSHDTDAGDSDSHVKPISVSHQTLKKEKCHSRKTKSESQALLFRDDSQSRKKRKKRKQREIKIEDRETLAEDSTGYKVNCSVNGSAFIVEYKDVETKKKKRTHRSDIHVKIERMDD